MKLFFFAIATLLLSSASAQVDEQSVPYKKPLIYRMPAPAKPVSEPPSHLGRLSHTLPNGNKVYSLPQDNMPCLVPGNGESNTNMPNIGTTPVYPYKYKGPGAIPNPAIVNDQAKKKTNAPSKR